MTQISCEIPLQGGRNILRKQLFLTVYLSVSPFNVLGIVQEILWGFQYATLGKLVLLIIGEAMINGYSF